MPILAVLLAAAQLGGATRPGGAAPSPESRSPIGLPFAECSDVQVVAPQLRTQPQNLTFSARKVLDLEFRTRLRRDLQGDHLLQLRVLTPRGYLYQMMTVPFSGSGRGAPVSGQGGATAPAASQATSGPAMRWVPGFPRPLAVQPLVPVGAGGQRQYQLTSRLPVAGTSITLGSLYGRWTVVPYLDGQSGPCGPARPFVIRE
jgi:hypothetical protein